MSLFLRRLIEWAGDRINVWLIKPWNSDAAFRSGFIRGAVLALVSAYVIGRLSAEILYHWGRIMQFFEPTAAPPSPEEGPRPVDSFVGCIVSLVALVVFCGFLTWLIGEFLWASG